MNTKIADFLLYRVANQLQSWATLVDKPGLLNGKMGIALFFYNYSRYSGLERFEKFADDLMENVLSELKDINCGFTDGLSGIGWSIEYLVSNGFIDADTYEVLFEVDSAVYSHFIEFPFPVKGQDLNGTGLYYLARIKGKVNQEKELKLLHLKCNLIYLIDSCERQFFEDCFAGINAPVLTALQLNSIVYFLKEANKLSLFPVKTARLLNYVTNNIDLFGICEDVDSFTLNSLISEYMTIKSKKAGDELRYSLDDSMSFIEGFSRFGLNSLLFGVDFRNDRRFQSHFKKVIFLLENDKYWGSYMTKVTGDTLGLYNGLAGLGLSILHFNKDSETN